MKLGAPFTAILLTSVIVAPRCRASDFDDDPQGSHQLSLADLAGYRAALSGKPTADDARSADPPAQVQFKDLWNRADVFLGRRVTVQGRVARIFRQGPVGSFPPLAEVWITSPAGDLFCAVFPQLGSTDDNHAETVTGLQVVAGGTAFVPGEKHVDSKRAAGTPEVARTVRFTGTFLKMVRYAGGDGPRLAPLVVGNRRPVPVSTEPIAADSSSEEADAITDVTSGKRRSGAAVEPACWALGLAIAVSGAIILARWHLGATVRPATGRAASTRIIPDPPLEFVEPRDEQ